MEKEVAAASEMVKLEVSGGFQGFKETVFNTLGNFFSWLSLHQGLAIILILVVLGIILWLTMRVRKYRIQVDNEINLKKKEIGKKDALIEEQKKKIANLEKKLSDKQAVASGAMLKTLSTLTGYDVDQLPTFFNSLSQISVNPLQMADPRAISTTGSQRLDAESDIAPGIDDASVRVVPGEDFSEKVEAKDEVASGEDFSEKDEAKDEVASDVDSSEENEVREKLASGEDLAKENDTKERLVSNHESLEKTDAKEGVAPEDDASKEDDVKKEKF